MFMKILSLFSLKGLDRLCTLAEKMGHSFQEKWTPFFFSLHLSPAQSWGKDLIDTFAWYGRG